MDKKDIPERCKSCEFILPYIEDIQRLETRQITPELRARIIEEKGLSPEDVDILDAENQLDLQESRKALSEVAIRTIGCAGVRSVVVDPAMQSSEGIILVCQSPFEEGALEED